MLSSHLVADLERVCDYLIVLAAARVQVAGEVKDLLAAHHLLTGVRRDPAALPAGWQVIQASHTGGQATLLVRADAPIRDPAWTVSPVGLEDLVLAYMSRAADAAAPSPAGGGDVTMIWLTWRQFRAQSVTAVVALAVLAVVYAVTGPRLAHLYDTSGLATCRAHGDCSALTSKFLDEVQSGLGYPALYILGAAVLYLTPALIGIFWGAPLITRELEAGTFRLAWNQSVTRTRWMAVKLGLIGLAAMVTVGAAQPHDHLVGRPHRPGRRIPAGHGPARPVLTPGVRCPRHRPGRLRRVRLRPGVTAGVLIRRTLPAMAVTLAGFAFVQLAWPSWVRPHLIPPVRATAAVGANPLNTAVLTHNGGLIVPVTNLPGAWIVSNQTITTAGHVFVLPDVRACASGTARQCNAWLATQHLRRQITYQPASRYWAFQWYETAIFLALALALAGFCVWWVRHRRLS